MFEQLTSEAKSLEMVAKGQIIWAHVKASGCVIDSVSPDTGFEKQAADLQQFQEQDPNMMATFLATLSRVGVYPEHRVALTGVYIYHYVSPHYLHQTFTKTLSGLMPWAAANYEFGAGLGSTVGGVRYNRHLTRSQFEQMQLERARISDQHRGFCSPVHEMDQHISAAADRYMHMQDLLKHDPTGFEAVHYIAEAHKDPKITPFGRNFHNGLNAGRDLYYLVYPLTEDVVPDYQP